MMMMMMMMIIQTINGPTFVRKFTIFLAL